LFGDIHRVVANSFQAACDQDAPQRQLASLTSVLKRERCLEDLTVELVDRIVVAVNLLRASEISRDERSRRAVQQRAGERRHRAQLGSRPMAVEDRWVDLHQLLGDQLHWLAISRSWCASWSKASTSRRSPATGVWQAVIATSSPLRRRLPFRSRPPCAGGDARLRIVRGGGVDLWRRRC